MRITDSITTSLISDHLSKVNDRMSSLQNDISSGVRIHQPSDDPDGAVRVAQLNSDMSRVTQYQSNAQEASSWLNMTDSTLGNIADDIRQAKTLGLQGANPLTADAREAVATQIDNLRQSLLAESNTKLGTSSIFAGYHTTTTPFADGAGGVTYSGDTGAKTVAVGDGLTVQANVTGDKVFNMGGTASAGTADVFTTLSNLSTAIRAGDQTGIQTGLKELDVHATRVTALRSDVGVQLNQTTLSTTHLTSSQTMLTSMLSDTQDTDLTQAVVQLKEQENIMQAASYVASSLARGGLLNWLK